MPYVLVNVIQIHIWIEGKEIRPLWFALVCGIEMGHVIPREECPVAVAPREPLAILIFTDREQVFIQVVWWAPH